MDQLNPDLNDLSQILTRLSQASLDNAAAFESALADVPHARIGEVVADGKLEIVGETPLVQADLAVLKEAWQKPLRW